jgi:GH24 family phage-related lysozyme (muramidase)
MLQTSVDDTTNTNTITASAEELNTNYDFTSSQKVVKLIESCEGFSKMAYWDYKQWTIGYGTYVASDKTYPNGITEAQAEQLLYKALEQFETYVNNFLKRNNVTVNQNQFDALVCFTYALPSWSFKGNEDYTIAQMLINGVENYSDQEVYDVFGLYVKAGSGENKKTLPGLVRRRVMEASLFLYGNTTTEVPLDVVNTANSTTETTTTTTATTETTETTTSKEITIDQDLVDLVNEDINNATSNTTTTTITTTDADVETSTWLVNEKDGIKLRHDYGLTGKRLTAIPDMAVITVTETVQADGYTWGKVTYNGFTGWCALDYCNQLKDFVTQGDISGDGQLLMTDLCMLKGYLNGTLQLTDEQLEAADINGDGVVSTTDYQKMLKAILLM